MLLKTCLNFSVHLHQKFAFIQSNVCKQSVVLYINMFISWFVVDCSKMVLSIFFDTVVI